MGNLLIQKAKQDDVWMTEAKGIWRTCVVDQGISGIIVRSATVACPDCGQLCSLTGHNIDDNGVVTPSVVCPHDGCSFHDFIQLEGWND